LGSLRTRASGKVYKHGKEIDISSIDKAIANGIAYATEDRKAYGLVLIEEIKNNITLTNLKEISDLGVINEPKEITVTSTYRDSLNIKCSSILQAGAQSFRREPAKGGIEQMAVREPRNSDPG
jgi:putative multiple sugar transport system ATP-binding protein